MKNLLVVLSVLFIIAFIIFLVNLSVAWDLSTDKGNKFDLISMNFRQKINPNVPILYCKLLYNSHSKEYEVVVDTNYGGRLGIEECMWIKYMVQDNQPQYA